ncbi:MAG: ribosome hibernation-promoting factor, HPF/YfiA family [Bradymonadia bacterium]|jgi:putative sigma-54 modulation protein
MQIDISFRHMDPSDPLKDYADEKIRRVIRKHIRDDFDAQVTLSIEKFRHIAKFHLSYKGVSVKCEESSDDMYTSIDLALDKLERQIRRYKDKLRTHKPVRFEGQRIFDVAVVAAPEPMDSEDYDAIDEEVVEEDLARQSASAKILKHEKIAVQTMKVDDAVMKITLEDLPVLIFINAETDALNVMYKLESGAYALIDPSLK